MNVWLLFSILAPLLWAFSNVIDSAVRRHYVKNDVAMTWFLSATRLPIIAVLFLIIGVKAQSYSAVAWMIAGGLLWIAPFILYYKTIEFEEMSRIILMMQLVPVFTLIIAFLALDERLSSTQIVAFILFLTGGAFAAMKRLKGIWHFSKAFWIILFATFLWASSDVIFKKFEPSFNSFLNAFSFYFLGSFLISPAMLCLSRGRKLIANNFSKLPLRAWVLLALDQLMGIFGSASFAYALTLGKASLTTVIIGIQPLFVIGFNFILSKFIEEIPKEDMSKKTLFVKAISFILIMFGLIYLQQ